MKHQKLTTTLEISKRMANVHFKMTKTEKVLTNALIYSNHLNVCANFVGDVSPVLRAVEPRPTGMVILL